MIKNVFNINFYWSVVEKKFCPGTDWAVVIRVHSHILLSISSTVRMKIRNGENIHDVFTNICVQILSQYRTRLQQANCFVITVVNKSTLADNIFYSRAVWATITERRPTTTTTESQKSRARATPFVVVVVVGDEGRCALRCLWHGVEQPQTAINSTLLRDCHFDHFSNAFLPPSLPFVRARLTSHSRSYPQFFFIFCHPSSPVRVFYLSPECFCSPCVKIDVKAEAEEREARETKKK